MTIINIEAREVNFYPTGSDFSGSVSEQKSIIDGLLTPWDVDGLSLFTLTHQWIISYPEAKLIAQIEVGYKFSNDGIVPDIETLFELVKDSEDKATVFLNNKIVESNIMMPTRNITSVFLDGSMYEFLRSAIAKAYPQT